MMHTKYIARRISISNTVCVYGGGVLLCGASQETHQEEPDLLALQTMESRKIKHISRQQVVKEILQSGELMNTARLGEREVFGAKPGSLTCQWTIKRKWGMGRMPTFAAFVVECTPWREKVVCTPHPCVIVTITRPWPSPHLQQHFGSFLMPLLSNLGSPFFFARHSFNLPLPRPDSSRLVNLVWMYKVGQWSGGRQVGLETKMILVGSRDRHGPSLVLAVMSCISSW